MRLYFVFLVAVAFFAGNISAATIEDAQKAYVSGDWIRAAETFDATCPALEAKARSECALWGVLARSQTGNAKDFSIARKKLDSLILATPDSLPVFSDLYMTRAQFELYLKRPDLSYRSLKTAFAKAETRQLSVIFQVCQSLYKTNPVDSVQGLCKEIERAKAETPVHSEASSSSTAGPSNEIASSSSAENARTEIPSPETALSQTESLISSSSSETPGKISSQDSAAAKNWSLQVGAFSISNNAEMLASSLRAKKFIVRVLESKTEERTLYLVQVGNFETREQAVDYGKNTLEPLRLEFQPVKKQESF